MTMVIRICSILGDTWPDDSWFRVTFVTLSDNLNTVIPLLLRWLLLLTDDGGESAMIWPIVDLSRWNCSFPCTVMITIAFVHSLTWNCDCDGNCPWIPPGGWSVCGRLWSSGDCGDLLTFLIVGGIFFVVFITFYCYSWCWFFDLLLFDLILLQSVIRWGDICCW